MDLDITQDQLDQYTKGEGTVQDIFPNLNGMEREFLMTGMTQADWDETFKE